MSSCLCKEPEVLYSIQPREYTGHQGVVQARIKPKTDEPITRCLGSAWWNERYTHVQKDRPDAWLGFDIERIQQELPPDLYRWASVPGRHAPAFDGYSIGKWDGNTLVVTTEGFRGGIWLDAFGDPLTDGATITERLRRVDFGHLQIDARWTIPRRTLSHGPSSCMKS